MSEQNATWLRLHRSCCHGCAQILEGGDPAEVDRVAQLLDYVDAELLGNSNFEFLQVLILFPCCLPGKHDARVACRSMLVVGPSPLLWGPLHASSPADCL